MKKVKLIGMAIVILLLFYACDKASTINWQGKTVKIPSYPLIVMNDGEGMSVKRYIPELYDSLVTSCITLRGRNPHQDLLYSELVDPCFHNPYGINWDEDRYEGYYRVTQKGKKCFYVYPMETLLKTDAGAICLKNFTGKISYMIDYEPVDLKTIEFTSGTVYITCEEEGIRCCITTDGVKIRQCIRVYLNNK